MRMLKMRLQRVGKKHDPSFRVVVTDVRKGPKAGRPVDLIGNYQVKKSTVSIDAEKAKLWMGRGVQVSDTVWNLLVSEGIVEGKKVNALPKKTVQKKEGAQEEKKEGEKEAETDSEENNIKEEAQKTGEGNSDEKEALDEDADETSEEPLTPDTESEDLSEKVTPEIASEDDPKNDDASLEESQASAEEAVGQEGEIQEEEKEIEASESSEKKDEEK